MKIIRRTTSFCLIAIFCLGFRSFGPKQKWQISNTESKLFLRFCETKEFAANDLPPGDVLSDTTLDFNSVVDSIIDDINSVSSSYLELADASRDPEYATATKAGERTIEICYRDYPDLSGGTATLKTDGSNRTGCDITLKPLLNESAKGFIKTLTHEIGHCLGLDHPQDTTHAIMSYFVDDDVVRIQMDDKMGLTNLYPAVEATAKEDATYGASCATRSDL